MCLGLSLADLLGEAPGAEAAPMPSLAAPHERVGDYELLDELGRGGMGVVFRARDLRLNRGVALKLILTGNLAAPAEVKRFTNEAEAAAHLEHPPSVPICEVGECEGRHFFAMKLMEGGTLAGRTAEVGERRSEGGDQRSDLRHPTSAVRLLAKVAHAIHHAHQRGVLHRGLTPGNILLDVGGEPMVSDFRLARLLEGASDFTVNGAILGSPNYMPPEQARGERQRTIAADVYSLGAIRYERLTGRPPLRADTAMATLRQVIEEEPVPPSIVRSGRRKEALTKAGKKHPSLLTSAATNVDRDRETICLKCLQKNPAQRYGPAEAIAEDLDRWLRHEPSRARPSQIWEHALKWTQRHPARAGLLAVALPAPAVIIAVLLVLGAKLAGERDRTREYLYAADMQVAQTALAEGNLSRAQRRTSRAARPCAPNSQSRFFAGWPLARLAGGGAGRPVLGYHHLAE